MKTTMKKNLNFRYSLQRLLYDTSNCGFVAYAATTLMGRGYQASQVGIILFSASIISFICQPLVASFADKIQKNIIPRIMLSLAMISILCFATAIFIKPPKLVFGLLYLVGLTVSDMLIPLFNALSVYYSSRNWIINYEVSRCTGAFGYALASLSFGKIMASRGSDSVVILAILLTVMLALLTFTYPEDNTYIEKTTPKSSSTVPVFVKNHSWFTVSLLGISFLALVHVMIENYLIEIVRRLNGDSSSVGISLCVATLIEAPFMLIYARIQKKIGSAKVLFIAGSGYVAKALLFVFAKSLSAIYIAQLLQAITYTFLAPVQMYYAEECTDSTDMVKGQSFATASYTLGCAFGNLLGGVIISAYGVTFMLCTAVAFAAMGTGVLMLSVPKARKNIRIL